MLTNFPLPGSPAGVVGLREPEARPALEVNDPDGRAVLGWPEEVIRVSGERLSALAGGHRLPADDLLLLQRYGLSTADQRLTRIGHRVADAMAREPWQSGDLPLRKFLVTAGLGPRDLIVDVGCGTGVTLRSLADGVAAKKLGIDLDGFALAMGVRLARIGGSSAEFLTGSAHSLPVADSTAACVVCRNALTYTHQRTTIREVCRILRPGGTVFIRTENLLFDLQPARHRNWRPHAAAGRAGELLVGSIRALSGWQPSRGRFWRASRAFAWWRRVRADLDRYGCKVTKVEPAQSCPTVLGYSTQTVIVGVKVA